MLVPFMEICVWFLIGENMCLGSVFELNPRKEVLHSHYMQNISDTKIPFLVFWGKEKYVGDSKCGNCLKEKLS